MAAAIYRLLRAPFNEVDNLVLARLSYIPLNGIINGFNDKTSHAAAGGSKEISDITAEHLPGAR